MLGSVKKVPKLNTTLSLWGVKVVEKTHFFRGMYIAFTKRCFDSIFSTGKEVQNDSTQ
jgi:hypothetical protein